MAPVEVQDCKGSLDSLSLLAEHYGSDKLGHYTPFYDLVLNSRRHRVGSVLEIGIHKGASLRMWRTYFPFAMVYGIDILPETMFEEDRIKTFTLNQANVRELISLAEKIGPFDVIVDDGSHHIDHQVGTMKTLMPYLRQHGVYIIEDVNLPVMVSDRIELEHTVISHRHSKEETGKCILIQK